MSPATWTILGLLAVAILVLVLALWALHESDALAGDLEE